jgi:hypothetical protein
MRAVYSIGGFTHGQSISLLGAETIAVFLSLEDEADNRTYALTAYHAVAAPFISAGVIAHKCGATLQWESQSYQLRISTRFL